MRIVRTLGPLELGGAQLSALRLSAAVRRHGTATTLLAGDATAPGLEVAARCGLPADAYRMRDRQVLASLQWTPPPGFACWLGPRLGRAGLVHARMVGGWRAAARALPPEVPLVASEHTEMCWPGRDHTPQAGPRPGASACSSRMGRLAAHGPLVGLDDGRLREGRWALEGLPAEPLPALPSPRLTFTGRFPRRQGTQGARRGARPACRAAAGLPGR
ncbi:MAG: hypothetical protein ACLPQY_30600 [Streptosporangiaceae bacterium]